MPVPFWMPAYWIVNLTDARLEVYSGPTGEAGRPDYRDRREYLPAGEVPLRVDGVEAARIPVNEFLG